MIAQEIALFVRGQQFLCMFFPKQTDSIYNLGMGYDQVVAQLKIKKRYVYPENFEFVLNVKYLYKLFSLVPIYLQIQKILCVVGHTSFYAKMNLAQFGVLL